MSSSAQDRTEPATPRQLRRAREQGDVARSADLTSSIVLVAGLATIAVRAGDIGTAARTLVSRSLGHAASPTSSSDVAELALVEAASIAAAALAPILLALALAAACVGWVQVGAVLSLDPLTPKLQRLDPISNLRNKYFSSHAWIELAKTFVKFAVVGGVTAAVVVPELGLLVSTVRADPMVSFHTLFRVLGRLAAWVAATFVAIGLVDIFLQRQQYTIRQRMTKEDVKRERKSQTGDPATRAARRRMHREILARRPLEALKKESDFVVRNPVHIACALRYDPAVDARPRLIAKGTGARAEEIVELARQAGLPILIDVPFARGCYQLDEDQEIEDDLVAAAVIVMHWVDELAWEEGWMPRWHQRRREAEVDDELDPERLPELVAAAGAVVRDPVGSVCLLAYDPERERYPRHLASVTGASARAVIELAERRGLPAVLDGVLARELRRLSAGETVPRRLVGRVTAALELAARPPGRT